MKKEISLIVLALFFINIASAQPPFEKNVGISNGLQIFSPQFEYLEQNVGFELHLHVSNISNGIQFNNSFVDCFVHLYDIVGNHTFESGILEKDLNGVDHEIYIAPENFSNIGINSFFIFCNTSNLGGEVRGTYEITENGRGKLTSGEGFLYIGSISSMFLFSLLLFFISTTFKPEKEHKKSDSGEEFVIEKGNAGLRFGFVASSFIVLVIAIYYVQISLIKGIVGFNGILDSYETFRYVALTLLVVIIIFVILSLLFHAINLWRIKKGKIVND